MFLLKRLISILFFLWAQFTILCILLFFLEGHPFSSEVALSEETLGSMLRHHGIFPSFFETYLARSIAFLQGNFSSMVHDGQTVFSLILEKFPCTLFLGFKALFLILPFSFLLGILGAVYQGTLLDRMILLFSITGLSLPVFITASFLQYTFAIYLPILPIAKSQGFSASILPTLSLTLLPTAYLTNLVRAQALLLMEKEWFLFALSKGTSPLQVALQQALKPLFLGVLGYLAPLLIYLCMGSFAIEKIFALPGLGKWILLSIYARDYPIIIGLTLFFSSLYLLFHHLFEKLIPLLDPRIPK